MSSAITPEEVPQQTLSPLQAFTGTFPKTRVSFVYQLGLAVVTLAMLMLPLIYVGLIFLAGKLVWWHMVNDTAIFEDVHGRATLVVLAIYLTPLIVGGIFVLFLVKPLFSRAAKPSKPFAIDEAAEPEFFAFIYKVCDLVGAPRPKEVLLDCQVNASASFRRGWWSLLGNDLRLTVGMPLLAGMTMRQLAGVLAHEFGHFAQGAGLRFTYLIRSVNGWFSRVVYERDAWDERLDDWATNSDWRLVIIFKCAQGGVWVGRKILWMLMMTGHFISCFMARQMEFDADSYEAKLAGSEEFPKTAQRLRLLSAAAGAAMGDAQSQFRQQQLPADLPALVIWRERTMPEEIRQKLSEQSAAEKTLWHHTHPADADRNREALALKAPGVFHLERPASELLVDFPKLSSAATRHYYQEELALNLDKVVLHETDKAVADRQSADEADAQLDRFFGEHFHVLRLHPLPVMAASDWSASKTAMQAAAKNYGKWLEAYVTERRKVANLSVAKDLLGAQYSISKPAEFNMAEGTFECAVRTGLAADAEIRRVIDGMALYENAVWARMAAAIQWVLDGNGDLADEERGRMMVLANAQRALVNVLPNVWRLRDGCNALELLYSNARNHPNGTVLQRQIDVVVKRLVDDLDGITNGLAGTGHPYLEGHPPIQSVIPDDNKEVTRVARAHQRAQSAIDTYVPLVVRICGDLANWALKAERLMEAENSPVSVAEATDPPSPTAAEGEPPESLPRPA